MDSGDIDPNFEPQTRARSNTWPLRPSRELELQSSPASEDSNPDGQKVADKDPLGLTAKKSGSRRNAWGNLSYADLITKAIQSSPEKRLTLSQIYDWMVQNVPYFKDKGDSTSSAGWKNSIRHNLSLHSRFMRIQNEGTGKSSWWVINPDAKPGKAPRRRAGSMETKNYEKKRGRVKKKVEALRAAMENGGSPLGGLATEEYLDLSFGDFRQRTSSNASSCGRLSPIQAGVEPDLHDNQVPPMSPIPWGGEVEDSPGMYTNGDTYSELVDSLVGSMKLSTQDSIDMVSGMNTETYLNSNGPTNQDYNHSPNSFMPVNDNMNDVGQYSHLPPPPPYLEHATPSPQAAPTVTTLTNVERTAFTNGYTGLHHTLNGYNQPDIFAEAVLDRINGSPVQLTINTQQLSSPNRSQQCSPSPQTLLPHLSPQARHSSPQAMSPLNGQLSPHRVLVTSGSQRNSPSLQAQQQAAIDQAAATASILRDALTRGPMSYCHQTATTTAQFSMGLSASPASISANVLSLGLSPHHRGSQHHLHTPQQLCSQSRHGSLPNFLQDTHTLASSCVGHLVSSLTPTTNIVDIDMDLVSLDIDMDQVITNELNLEGSLDFNFEGMMNAPSTTASQNIVH